MYSFSCDEVSPDDQLSGNTCQVNMIIAQGDKNDVHIADDYGRGRNDQEKISSPRSTNINLLNNDFCKLNLTNGDIFRLPYLYFQRAIDFVRTGSRIF